MKEWLLQLEGGLFFLETMIDSHRIWKGKKKEQKTWHLKNSVDRRRKRKADTWEIFQAWFFVFLNSDLKVA